MSVLGDRLRAERNLKGWTLDQLAGRLDMAKTTVYNHEKGASEPDIDTLRRYAKLYDVAIAYLVGTTDKRQLPEGEVDADIALRIQGISSRLTPEAKADLMKALDWIERDIAERQRRGELK